MQEQFEVYISVHDQDLILNCEKNRLFRYLTNYKYLFLGMRPIDKLDKIMDKVLVVRDLPVNIENKKCLYDYTGQYALARNEGLVKAEYVIIIHYDCFIKKNFLHEIMKAFEKNPNCFINFQPHKLTCNYFLPDRFAKAIKQACKEVYGIDIEQKNKELIEKGDKFWQGGGSFACSLNNLKKFIDWNDPLLPYIEADSMAAHNIERTVKFFCVENKLQEVFLSDIMEHIFNASHDQNYQTTAQIEKAKKRFEKFMSGKLFLEEKLKPLKKFIQNIFSVKNADTHKVLCICFIKFKFKRKNRRS